MLNQLYYKLRHPFVKFFFSDIYPVLLKHRAKKIGKKDKIEVVFFAMNLALWRYQGVYELLSKDPRFNCHIVFTVPNTFSGEQIAEDLQKMRVFFDSKGIKYEDYDAKQKSGFDVKGLIDPDILFYPQPYEKMYPANHDHSLFRSKLLCYIPYSVNVGQSNLKLYDLPFHNFAWKVYTTLQIEKRNAKEVAKNRGRNWLVAGYCNLDEYCNGILNDVWKTKDRSMKRLIWAPHFTIAKVSWIRPRSNFLWMAQLMIDIAEKYNDKLQIAFKPHPRLKSELYKHPDWGKERTDDYYQRWANQPNTQLETEDFVDLFKTSDALIHDCASFTAEYLYVNKPVAFVTKNLDQLNAEQSQFGQLALQQHYIVENDEEVLSFIIDVVLGGEDTKKEQRTQFFETVLKPNVTGSTSQFIVDDMKKSLGL